MQQLSVKPDKEADVGAGGGIFHSILGRKEDMLTLPLM